MSAEPAAVALLFDPGADARRDRLADLFDTHEERLYRLARRLTSDADAARDLVQDAFFKAARSLHRVPAGRSREEAWLVRVLVNIRRDQWRRTAVRKRAALELAAGPATCSATPESALIVKRAVWAALDVLHPRRRAIVVMHEIEGMDIPGIAACLGVTMMTVRWHLSMARRELRPLLEGLMGDMR